MRPAPEPITSASDPELLTISEAAAFLNVKERWMRRAVQEKRLPYLKLGRQLRFLKTDLQAHLLASRVEPPPEPTRPSWTLAPLPPPNRAARRYRTR